MYMYVLYLKYTKNYSIEYVTY